MLGRFFQSFGGKLMILRRGSMLYQGVGLFSLIFFAKEAKVLEKRESKVSVAISSYFKLSAMLR